MANALRSYRESAGRQRQGVAQVVSQPSPVGGWNTRDDLDTMSEDDALVLDNIFPGVGSVSIRGGFEDYVGSGIGSSIVETLSPLAVGAGEVFIAGTDNKIYDITNGGSPSNITGAHTITVNRWQTTAFADSATPGAPIMLAVNGTDTPWTWGGTGNIAAWAFGTLAGGALTEENFIGVHVFKNRVFLWEDGSRDFWDGVLGKIPGTGGAANGLTRFPLSGIRGAQGNLLFMATWTRDGGAGPDDYAVFVTDQGQAIVYAGTDPTTDWSIVGVYRIPRPVGRQAWTNLFGDLLIATDADYVYLSTAAQEGGLVSRETKLSGAIQDVSAKYRTNDGWQMLIYPRGQKIISNIPLTEGAQYHQHVLNTETRAGCRFTGWNFGTFGLFNGNLYGGGIGRVLRCDIGRADDADGTKQSIKVRCQTAWTDLGAGGSVKRVSAVRPLMRVSELFEAGLFIAADFEEASIAPQVSFGTPASSPAWDTVAWDSTLWESSANSGKNREWRALGGVGSDFSLIMNVDIIDQALTWISTDYLISAAPRAI